MRNAAAAPSWFNLPNAISLTRIPMAAGFVLVDGFPARFAIVALSAVSDWVDGRLARRSGRVTRAGELLDPIADRTFMIAALVTLAVERTVPLWTLPLLLLRDIGVMLGGALILAIRPGARLPARRAGKRVTWLQFLALAVIVFWPAVAPWVAVPIAVLGLLALRDYARAAAPVMSDRKG